MKTNLDEYKEMMHVVRRALGSEKERLTERIEQVDGVMKVADMTDELLSEIDDLKEENERLNAENERLREDVQEKEMKLSELTTWLPRWKVLTMSHRSRRWPCRLIMWRISFMHR